MKEILDQMYVHLRIDGVPISFTRRRYSNRTFTWVDAHIDGKWQSLGDPWPCVTPARKELAAAIKLVQGATNAGTN